MRFLDLGQHSTELLFEPGMQDGIGHRDHTLGADVSGGWAKECQQFGGSSTLVLVRLEHWMALWLPRGTRLRESLIRPSLILIELHDPRRFRLLVGQLNQSFFSGVSGS